MTSFAPAIGVTSSPTYSSSGIKYNSGEFNITSTAPFTYLINQDSAPGHISIYNRTNYAFSGLTGTSKHGFLESFGREQSISFSPNGISASLWNNNGPMSFTSSSTSGFFIFSNVDDNGGVTASTTNPYRFYLSRNGQILGSQSSTKNFHTFGSSVVLGAFGDDLGDPSIRSYDEISWYSIGSGFGENSPSGRQIDITKQEKFFQIIYNLQIALNREIDI